MSEENHTVEQHNRSRWTGDEMDRLKQVYTDTPPMDTKRGFWEEVARRFDDNRGWQSMRHRLELPPKLVKDSCKIHRLYCTLGDSLGDVAERYGRHASFLTACRKRGWLPADLVYKMLDDAMVEGGEWEESDARGLQGIDMDA